MTRRVLLVLAVSVVLAGLLTTVASARTLVVGSGPACRDGRFATIQAGIDAAAPGDQITVCAGTYREFVLVSKQVKLISRTPHGAVIKAPDAIPHDALSLVNIQVGGTLLRGFSIEGPIPGPDSSCSPNQLGSAGVEAPGFGGPSITIDHNRILNAHPPGCLTEGSGIRTFGPSVDAYENDIGGYGAAGVAFRVGSLNFHSNRLTGAAQSGSGVGVFLDCGSASVGSNSIEGNSLGIGAFGEECEGFQATIAGNRVSNNGEGIRMDNIGIGVGNPLPLSRVQQNFVLDNAGDGIHNAGSGGVLFRGNRSLGNGGFDCIDDFIAAGFGGQWQDNVGLTDQPKTLCRPPN